MLIWLKDALMWLVCGVLGAVIGYLLSNFIASRNGKLNCPYCKKVVETPPLLSMWFYLSRLEGRFVPIKFACKKCNGKLEIELHDALNSIAFAYFLSLSLWASVLSYLIPINFRGSLEKMVF